MKISWPPPFSSRVLWWAVVPFVAGAVGLLVDRIWPGLKPARGGDATSVVMLAGWVVAGVYFVRLRRRLRKSDWRLCLKCGYDLSGLEDEGTCPECGVPYRIHEVRKQWRG